MKLNNINKHLAAAALVALAAAAATSCSDAWDDHYSPSGQEGADGSSLMQLIEADPQLSDFVSVLKATHLFTNNHSNSVTYADLLASDQTLTVWAPVNGSFNRDSLLALCQTAKGDSSVSVHFAQNHIAHNSYNMNSQTDETVRMLNDKQLQLTPKALFNAQVVDGAYNKAASNGLLHVVKDDANYTYNIYEGLTSLGEFSHIGDFFFHYEQVKLDEDRSVVSGLVDGKKVYSDSVMYRMNLLFNTFNNISVEDSTYGMIVPDRETWQPVYDEAKTYFNYGTMAKADSVSTYWTSVALISDLIWNRNRQRTERDSIFTTSYLGSYNWPYHVYKNPYSSGGYLDPANIKDSLQCSNGTIFRLRNWPFEKEQIYFKPVITQAENSSAQLSSETTKCTVASGEAQADSVSANGFVTINPNPATADWTATWKVYENLSGRYDVCAIILPKTVVNPYSRDFSPNKFEASISYIDENGDKQTESFNNGGAFYMNDPYHVDTVKIATVDLPVCAYGQQDPLVTVTLKCNIKKREQSDYSREMLLDAIYLKPAAAAAPAKNRKEARK